jgi:hypothetical protein
MAGANSVTDINSICYQRQQLSLFYTAPARLTPSNPYQIKQQQDPANYNFNAYYNKLNMRRKAEVLSYNQTQNSGSTKKTRFTQLAKGNYRGNTLFCPTNSSIPTPSSSCDVPGPVTYLYRDDSIPLYNYATNIDPYSIINSTPTTEWDFFATPNVLCQPNTTTSIAKLVINDSIKSQTLSFSFSTPIAIYATGSDLNYSSFDVSFNMSALPTCSVYFSNQLVSSVSPIVTSPSNIVSIHGSLRNAIYSTYIYYGVLTVSNLILYTYPGYVYDIRINFPLNITASDTSVSANSSFAISPNLPPDIYSQIISSTPNPYRPINCTINGQNNPPYSAVSSTAK